MARKVLIQIRRGLESAIGTLAVGELGYCTDTSKLYIGTAGGNVLLVAAQSTGDMLKSIYDTNNDGKVDYAAAADSVAWSGVSGKPSSMPANGGNSDTVDGKHAAQMTTRVNLYGQLQSTSYRRSVIALCEVTNTDQSANSYSIGTLTFHRSNGLAGTFIALVGAEKKYNSTTLNYSGMCLGSTPVQFRPCTFTYGGKKYGGVELFLSDAEFHYIEFNGATNFGIFGLDYYNAQTSSAINTEVNNSLNFAEPVLNNYFRLNGQQIWTQENFDPDSKMPKGPLTWGQLKGV